MQATEIDRENQINLLQIEKYAKYSVLISAFFQELYIIIYSPNKKKNIK